MRMEDGGSVEEYLRNARDLKSNLAAMGHKIVDETLVRLTLNGLPLSYKEIIQSLSVLDKLPTFALISSKLLNESHRLSLCRNCLGEERALLTQFQRYQPRHQIFDRKKQHTQGRRDHSTHSRINQPFRFKHRTSNQGFQGGTSCISYRKTFTASYAGHQITYPEPAPTDSRCVKKKTTSTYLPAKNKGSLKRLVEGMPLIPAIKTICEQCLVGKEHRGRFPKKQNRTVFERARNTLASCNLPGYLLSKVVNIENFLFNRSQTVDNRGVTPYERYYNSKLNVNFFKIFGCLVYVHVLKIDRNKLESKTKKCLLMGFDKQTKAYHLFDPSNQKIILSRDIA
uniref:Retroviral polymerase SH3-like domain-containing protein n=1 Tax=Physcomitrium patens TaxID=3218 RepID=A0A7I4BWV6_PHYPA